MSSYRNVTLITQLNLFFRCMNYVELWGEIFLPHNALRILMTKLLMSKFNKQGLGTKGKRGLKDTNIYKLIVGGYSIPVQENFKGFFLLLQLFSFCSGRVMCTTIGARAKTNSPSRGLWGEVFTFRLSRGSC